MGLIEILVASFLDTVCMLSEGAHRRVCLEKQGEIHFKFKSLTFKHKTNIVSSGGAKATCRAKYDLQMVGCEMQICVIHFSRFAMNAFMRKCIHSCIAV